MLCLIPRKNNLITIKSILQIVLTHSKVIADVLRLEESVNYLVKFIVKLRLKNVDNQHKTYKYREDF